MYNVNLKTPSPLWDIGSKAAGGLFSLLSGRSWQDKTSEWLANYLKQNMNRPLISQGQINAQIPQLQQSLTPSLNQIANRASQAGVLNSGVGRGEIANQNYSGLMQLLGQLQQKALFANAEAPLQRQQLLASLTR